MRVPLRTVVREWGRIGLIGFGGPPAHVALLRELTVERRGWIEAREFEDANAACQLLPGPGSTQMAIYTAQRVAGRTGAIVGGLGPLRQTQSFHEAVGCDDCFGTDHGSITAYLATIGVDADTLVALADALTA